ncbi:MAG: terminase family protein [Rhodocyclaceae bacterium]|nr:terminase family protein [Rhodocyclaceae bacterium]
MSAVLLPYQQAWMADRSPVKVVEKSRRIGLSWAEAAMATLEAARQNNGQDSWYLGYSQDMAQEFIRDCAFWVRHFQFAASAAEEVVVEDEGNDILAYRIHFASGKRITALSSSPRNLRGKQGRVIIDEAAFHPDLGELLKAAFALLIWGGTVSVISTHFGTDNPFNELVQDVREGRKPYSLHRITFDDAVEQGLCRRIFEGTGRQWSPQAQAQWVEEIRTIYRPNDAEELDCIPSNSSGAYLTRALIESRMTAQAPVLRYTCAQGFEQQPDAVREAHAQEFLEFAVDPVLEKLPRSARASVGMDFGRSGDLSVLVPLLEGAALEREAPFILEMRNVPFRQQEQIVFWICDRLPRFTFGAFDARGNGQYLAEVAMQRYGSHSVAQVMLSQNWYLENMPRMKAALEDGTLKSLPKDRDILDDLRAITVLKGIPRIPEGKTKSGAQQRHGDAAVALCLAWFASAQGGGAIEYMEVPRREVGRMTGW